MAMEFTGRYLIAASPSAVWDAIQDPVILKTCIPRCESITKTSPSEFIIKAIVKVGPVRARFEGRLDLRQREAPVYCHIVGAGKGRLAGVARGTAEVGLVPEGDGTIFHYTIIVAIGGRIGQLAQRLVDSAAQRIADDFFARFAEFLETLRADGVWELDTARPTAQPG